MFPQSFRVEVWEGWENEKCCACGNTSRRRVFPQLFRVLPNLHECFYNSTETRRKCFLFLLENSPRKITKNEENLIVLFIIKTQILYTTQFTRHLNLNFFVFLSSYGNTIINQSARVIFLSYFLIYYAWSLRVLELRAPRILHASREVVLSTSKHELIQHWLYCLFSLVHIFPALCAGCIFFHCELYLASWVFATVWDWAI